MHISVPFFIHINTTEKGEQADLDLTHLRNAMYKLFMDLWAMNMNSIARWHKPSASSLQKLRPDPVLV